MLSLQDYLYQFKAGMEAVTADEVLGAARRHLHPERQAVVVVGDARRLGPALEAAGVQVTPFELEPL